MSGRVGGTRPTPGSILLGILRLARGRADGMGEFGATRDAFLTSLAPLIAFPLVGGVLMLLGGGGLAALTELLATLCGLLAPPVLTFEVARLWGKQVEWLRFATAFNWCQWVIPFIGGLLLLMFGILVELGLPQSVARSTVLLGLIGYGLWLHWFLARHGLGLSWWRALVLVIGVNAATVLIVAGPQLLAAVAEGGH